MEALPSADSTADNNTTAISTRSTHGNNNNHTVTTAVSAAGVMAVSVQEVHRPVSDDLIEPVLVQRVVNAHRQFMATHATNSSATGGNGSGDELLKQMLRKEHEVQKLLKMFCVGVNELTITTTSSSLPSTVENSNINRNDVTSTSSQHHRSATDMNSNNHSSTRKNYPTDDDDSNGYGVVSIMAGVAAVSAAVTCVLITSLLAAKVIRLNR